MNTYRSDFQGADLCLYWESRDPVPAPVFEFDGFELDVGGYQLRRAGRKIRLQRVPMDLLILLVERRGKEGRCLAG